MTDLSRIALSSCPFCGGACQAPQFYGESKTARFVACKECGANLYRGGGQSVEENDSAAIAAWNRRASSLGAEPVEYEGYPGIAHDFEKCKAQLRAAQSFFESPQSFSQDEFRQVGREVFACAEYTGSLPIAAPQPAVRVTDVMVEAACKAYDESEPDPWTLEHRSMRSALQAAFEVSNG
jgi:Lar family restriction alleviation protein